MRVLLQAIVRDILRWLNWPLLGAAEGSGLSNLWSRGRQTLDFVHLVRRRALSPNLQTQPIHPRNSSALASETLRHDTCAVARTRQKLS